MCAPCLAMVKRQIQSQHSPDAHLGYGKLATKHVARARSDFRLSNSSREEARDHHLETEEGLTAMVSSAAIDRLARD